MNDSKLKPFQLDVIREIGNIGSGNALTSLSKLLKRPVEMKVPKINILEYKDVTELAGGAENPVVGILLNVSGDINGSIMFILEPQYAISLVNMLRHREVTSVSEFNDIDISALKEVGNILTGSYLTALSKLCKLNVLPSVPHIMFDMAGAVISIPAIQFGQLSDNILYIETMFAEGNNSVMGKFFLIPDWNSYEKLLKALGV